MTKKEIKKLLNERCNESWEMLKLIKNEYGESSLQAEKALTKWATYDDIFRELYNESPLYSF